ncbi:MAG: GxxExxY protein [Novosphingobium sp.]
MLESAYEAILVDQLRKRGLEVRTQVPIAVEFEGSRVDQGFRADIVVEQALLIELKSIERLTRVHAKQVLTYLRFMHLPVGLLMNFGAPLFRDGLKRIVNRHSDTSGSQLRINQNAPNS